MSDCIVLRALIRNLVTDGVPVTKEGELDEGRLTGRYGVVEGLKSCNSGLSSKEGEESYSTDNGVCRHDYTDNVTLQFLQLKRVIGLRTPVTDRVFVRKPFLRF